MVGKAQVLHYLIEGDPTWGGTLTLHTDRALLERQAELLRRQGLVVKINSLSRDQVDQLLIEANRRRNWGSKVKLPTGEIITAGVLREAYADAVNDGLLARMPYR